MLLSPLIQLECYYPAQVACIKKSRELLINKNTVKNNRCYAYIYSLLCFYKSQINYRN